jgi:FtsZ-interacting cell division protein ZipA
MEVGARAAGLQFGAMNIYHMKNDQALGCRHRFSLANLYKPGEFDPAQLDRFRTQGLTLFMNVPCTYQPVRVFDQMVEVARVLATRLDGRIEDHDHRPLTDQGLQVIRTQIERISAEMTNRGIVPGSTTAMRLFS